jgi:cytochrome c biogenesis protein CcdA
MILLGFAFLAGAVTMLAPCILPILPIVLSGGAIQGRARPWGILLGIVLSFSLTTLVLGWLVSRSTLSPNAGRVLGIAMLFTIALLLLAPGWLDRFESWMSRVTARTKQPREPHGFFGGLLLGLSLGLVWTPCAGPILASVLAASAAQSIHAETVAVTIAYALGAGIPLALLAALGQRLTKRLRFFQQHARSIQAVFGGLLFVLALLMSFNLDRSLQASILKASNGWVPKLQRFEEQSPLHQTGGFCPLGDACR